MAFFLWSCGGNTASTEGDAPAGGETAAAADAGASSINIDKAMAAYFNLKNALVSSDPGTAKIAASKLAMHLEGDAQASAQAVFNADELPQQRAAFEQLSQQLYTLLKSKGGNRGVVYKQFCPMAFDNKGAFWLSEESDIKNPYFGDEMLTCGSVQEEIAAVQ
jgi:hypothetical protein